MKSKLKKYLYFDASDSRQAEIFFLLDKARYFQTKLIVRLLGDFFEKHGITRDTPPEQIKVIVQLYLTKNASTVLPVSPGAAFTPDEITKIFISLLPQIKSVEHTASSIPGCPPDHLQLQALPPAAIKQLKEADTENDRAPLPNAPEAEIAKLKHMAQGFLSMAGE